MISITVTISYYLLLLFLFVSSSSDPIIDALFSKRSFSTSRMRNKLITQKCRERIYEEANGLLAHNSNNIQGCSILFMII